MSASIFNIRNGVTNSFLDTRLDWTDSPKLGDIVFMDGHMGIYGVDDQGAEYIYHSAPAIDVEWYDEELKEYNSSSYSSGPRINSYRDAYWNQIIHKDENDLFENWKQNYLYNYGGLY